jgi:hypothetical protein
MSQQFAGAIGDDLIHVHVGLRAGAGLPHRQRKVRVVPTRDHLVRSRGNRDGEARVDEPERLVDPGSSSLDLRDRMDQGKGMRSPAGK